MRITMVSPVSLVPTFIGFMTRTMLLHLSPNKKSAHSISETIIDSRKNIKWWTLVKNRQVMNLPTRLDFLRSLLWPWDFLVLSLSVSWETWSGLWCCFLLFSLEMWTSFKSTLSLSVLSLLCVSSFHLSRPPSFSLLCFDFLLSLSSLSFSFFAYTKLYFRTC